MRHRIGVSSVSDMLTVDKSMFKMDGLSDLQCMLKTIRDANRANLMAGLFVGRTGRRSIFSAGRSGYGTSLWLGDNAGSNTS